MRMCVACACVYPLEVHVIQVVLHELDHGREVSLIELVRDVPTQWAELPSLLHCGVDKSHSIQHGLPLREVADLQLLLADVGVGAPQACLDALRGLTGVLDAGLQQVDGELRVHLGGDPQAELAVDILCLQHGGQNFIQEVQTEVAVLQEDPSPLCVLLLESIASMHLLPLAHGDGLELWGWGEGREPVKITAACSESLITHS